MKSIPALDQNDFDPTPAAKPRRALNRRGPAPLALEPRVMFDGATADAAVAAAKAAAADVPAERAAEHAPAEADTHVAAAVLAPEAQRHEIVFIEDNVPDYQKLAAAVTPGVEVVVLDHTKDGLQQMIAALDGRAPVDAIHLVTHGAQGRIELGASVIDSANVEQYGVQLAALGQHLNAGADLMIYGCDVADGAGTAFIDRIAQLTGADVAASTDLTGSRSFGANWELEAHTGSIESTAMTLDRAGWEGVLDNVTVYDANWQALTFNGKTAFVGNGTADGDVVRFNTVITINGQAIDAVVKTTIKDTTISAYDSTANPSPNTAYFQPTLNTTAVGGNATFTISFYLGGTYTGEGTGLAATLQNVVVNSYDIDSTGGGDRQFQSFKGFARYELSNSTYLVPTVQSDGTVTFLYTSTTPVNNGNVTADGFRVRVYYDSMSTFQVNAGVAGATGQAYFAFDFSIGPNWTGATTVTGNPAPNLSYSTTTLAEDAGNDGSITATSTITLVNGSFAGTDGQELAGVSFANLPSGLTAHVTRVDATHATLGFTGNALAHANANDVRNFGVTFGNAAFASGNAGAVTGASRSDLTLDFNDPPPDTAAPVVTGGQAFAYAENRSAGTVVGTVAATDDRGVTGFRFAASGTATSADGYFSIGSDGVVKLTAAGAAAGKATNDYEIAPNSFQYAVQARDAAGNWSTATDVTLNVTNLDETAPAFTSGATANPVENQAVLYTAQAADLVDFTDKAVSYGLKPGVGDASALTIDSTTGVVSLASGKLDFETKSSYNFTVTARDATGNVREQAVSVSVADVDEVPPTVTISTTNPNVPLKAGDSRELTFTFSEEVGGSFTAADVRLDSGSIGPLTQVDATHYTATYTPGSGVESGSVKVSVGSGSFADLTGNVNVAPATLTLAVDTVAPHIASLDDATGASSALSVPEGTSAVHTFTASESVTWSLAGGEDAARFTISPGGALSFISAPDYEAPQDGATDGRNTYLVQVRAVDAAGNVSIQSVKVSVTNVNELPVAAPDSIVTAEDTAWHGQLPAASDPDHDTVTYAKAGDPAHGTVSIEADGSYTYTPAADYHGSDIFTYTVNDGNGGSRTYTVSVTVTPVNDAPVASNAAITTAEDTAKTGNLPQPRDVDGDVVVYAKAGDPAHGTVSVTAIGGYTYTPAANYNGPDSFTYTVDDGHGGSNTYTVEVTVTPVNDAPVAANASIATLEDTPKTGTLPQGRDVDGDTVTYTRASGPANGTVVIEADGSYTYTPATDYNGPDSFTYTISDGHGGSNTYTVDVTVGGVNDAPVAGNATITTAEDTVKTGTLPQAHDVDGDIVTYAKAGDPAHGTVSVKVDGSYTYTPAADYNGKDSFSYTVSDGHGGSNTYTVEVTVTPVNDAPVASNAAITTAEDTAKTGNLPQPRDVDGDVVVYAKAGDPAHGTVSVTAIGGYTYTPAANYNGPDSFTYTVDDGHGGSNTYTVEVTVTPVNDAPVASNAAITTAEDTAKTGNLPQPRDVDGDVVVYAKAGDPAHGTVSVTAIGGYTYTPAANYNGPDSFTYTVDDGHGGSNTYTVEVTVTPVNDAPVASNASIATLEDTPKTGTLPQAHDVDGDTVTYAKAGDPAHGSVTIGTDGRYTYTPAADYNGKDSFSYTVSDGHGGSTTYTVDVTVTPVNDAPVAANTAITTAEDTIKTGTLPQAHDVDGDTVTYAKAGDPAHGSVSVKADGSYTYTPAADYNGKDSFSYTVSDGHGGSNTYTVDVTVTPVNDAPVAHGGATGQGTVGEPLGPVTIPAFSDVDGPAITYTAVQADGSPLPSWLVFDPATRSFEGTPPKGSLGTWTIVVTGSDGSLDAKATVTIEVGNPALPGQVTTITSMTKDTGASPTDFVTSDGSAGRTVSGTIGAPLGRNEVVQVSFDGGSTWSTAKVDGGTWSAVDNGAHSGNWTIEARVTNVAAGLAGPTASREAVLDTTPPAAPTVDSIVTTSTTPVLHGGAIVGEGEILRVTVDGATYEVPVQDSRWTLDLASAKPVSGSPAQLTVGKNYDVTATVTDLAGNVRDGANQGLVSVTPPVQAPEAPPAAVQAATPATPAVQAPTPVAEPTPVPMAMDSRVNNDSAPGSLASGDSQQFGYGQGTRATETAVDLRGAALSDIYTRTEGFRTVVAKAEEPALVLFQGVPDQFAEAGANLSMTVPADAFAHTQPGATVRLIAVQQDGRPLPTWVQFNGQTGQFTGDVPKGLKGELKIKLVARDLNGHEAAALFRINVGQQRAVSSDTAAAPAGKPGLSAQLRAGARGR